MKHIKKEESLLHHVINNDKKKIKEWENKARKGEILRIM